MLQIRHVRATYSRRVRDLGLVKGTIKKNLIELERLQRDTEVQSLQNKLDALDHEILEIDRILLSITQLP